MVAWKDKCQHSNCPLLLLSSSQLLLPSLMPHGMEYLCFFWGQLPLLGPLLCTILHNASLLAAGVSWGEEQTRPWGCASTAQQQKHPCVINIVFITSPKHNPSQIAMKENNSIPTKISTVLQMFQSSC